MNEKILLYRGSFTGLKGDGSRERTCEGDIRRRLIQNRADRGQWSAVEKMCQEAIAETPDDSGFAWGLITAQANQGHLHQAWSSFKQLNPPVSAPALIPLLMPLHPRFASAAAAVAP